MNDYSVTIRTLGAAGNKYQKTLNSIASQTIPPKEIIIVLAEGYPLPPEKLGYEKFIYVPKEWCRKESQVLMRVNQNYY